MADVMVKQGEEPIAEEVLATSILRVSNAVQRMVASGLTRRALVVLIKGYDSGLSVADIERVLSALGQLERVYLTPKKKPVSK